MSSISRQGLTKLIKLGNIGAGDPGILFDGPSFAWYIISLYLTTRGKALWYVEVGSPIRKTWEL